MGIVVFLMTPYAILVNADLTDGHPILDVVLIAILAAVSTALFGSTLWIGGVEGLTAVSAGFIFSAHWIGGGFSILASAYLLGGLILLAGDRLLSGIAAAGLSNVSPLQSWVAEQGYGWLVIVLVLLYFCTFGLLAGIRKALK
jgi:hypothetical protein